MCVSAFKAGFTETTILMHEPEPAKLGHHTRVMLYQNTTQNWHKGPNAMLLHLDSARPMSPGNFVETTKFPHLLEDMVDAVRPHTRDIDMGTFSMAKGAQVFDVGIYTVVLGHAADIPAALNLVPQEKRPQVNGPLFEFYAEAFPSFTIALCCFSASAKSEPLMLWWEPQDPNVFRMPGLDEHTGGIPRFGEPVWVDHWLLASSYRMKHGTTVEYTDNIPQPVLNLLPYQVIGRHFSGMMPNGDFGFHAKDLRNGHMPEPMRLAPPA